MKQIPLLALLVACCMSPFEKAKAQTKNVLQLDQYKKITADQLEAAARQSASDPSKESTWPTLRPEDIQGAQLIDLKNEATPVVFASVVRRDGEAVGVLAGYPVRGGVFNVYYSFEGSRDSKYPGLGVYLINGTRLGSVIFNEEGSGRVVPVENTEVARRGFWQWLACTGDCVGDAQIACNSNAQCAILLISTNIGGSAIGAGPIGTVSIAMACGIACTANSSIDLLPAF
ncbi:hypothetical protein [Flaviaesturariibacter amylovorans]|uniref:Uncharacterized protein n=1 Tax=Flaviaesturariibacter amylovorans TaxID=1084520 RepID=A0ABP8H9H6_9BACT